MPSSINSILFRFVLDRPRLLKALLSASNFEKFPVLQNVRNICIAKAIEGEYSAGETLESAKEHMSLLERQSGIGTILNYAMEAADKEGIKLMEKEYYKILDVLKEHPKSCVALKPTSLIDPNEILELSQKVSKLSYDKIDIDTIIQSSNIEKIASPFLKLTERAIENGTRILIDAEQSNLQPGVDILACYLMLKFNRCNKSNIYNTYQLYLKDSPKRLFAHKMWLEGNSSKMAAKIVRGAYLSYEAPIQTHVQINYQLCGSKSDVDKNYNDTASILVGEDKTDLVVATHNINSILNVRNIIESKQSIQSNIEFGYLMGFGDRIRSVLDGSYKFLEYVPYGPVEVKIPYLLRRLEENISIFSQK